MAVEFTTPPAITISGMRFVFFFKPQLVVDTFDNIPNLYLDVMEKAAMENIERLYVTCKFPNDLEVEPIALEGLAKEIYKEFWAYLKKHFGSKVAVIESPCLRNSELSPYPIKDIFHDLLQRKSMLTDGDLVDHLLIQQDEVTGTSVCRIYPALLNAYVFGLWSCVPDLSTMKLTVLTGTAEYLGQPKNLVIDNLSDLHLPLDVLEQFISPRLIEAQLNRALQVINGYSPDGLGVYVRNVQLNDF